MGWKSKTCGCGAKIEAASKMCGSCRLGLTVPLVSQPVAHLPQSYDEALVAYRKWIGQSTPPPKPKARTKFSDERILICSDLHAPFHHPEAVAAAFSQEADTLIIAGDLQDHYSISRFLKYEAVPIQQELAAAQMLMEQASANFSRVMLIEGNHDSARFVKLLASRLDKDAIDIITHLSGGTLSSIEVLARQFKNVELVKTKVGTHTIDWFLQKGDLIVSHAEKYSRVPGSALRGIEDWFSDFEQTLGLAPWRVLVQAHTHAMALLPFGADKVLVETGCLCRVHGYQLSARIAGRPQRLGWTRMTQRDGVTDLSSIGLHWWHPKREAA